MKYAIVIHHQLKEYLEPIQESSPETIQEPVQSAPETITEPPVGKRLKFSNPIEIPPTPTRNSSPSNITFSDIYPEFDDPNLLN